MPAAWPAPVPRPRRHSKYSGPVDAGHVLEQFTRHVLRRAVARGSDVTLPGFDLTQAMPMPPPAPARFSTTRDCLRWRAMASATGRPTISATPRAEMARPWSPGGWGRAPGPWPARPSTGPAAGQARGAHAEMSCLSPCLGEMDPALAASRRGRWRLQLQGKGRCVCPDRGWPAQHHLDWKA